MFLAQETHPQMVPLCETNVLKHIFKHSMCNVPKYIWSVVNKTFFCPHISIGINSAKQYYLAHKYMQHLLCVYNLKIRLYSLV